MRFSPNEVSSFQCRRLWRHNSANNNNNKKERKSVIISPLILVYLRPSVKTQVNTKELDFFCNISFWPQVDGILASLTLNVLYHTTLVEVKDMHSLHSFAQTNPEVSESPLFILSTAKTTFNKSIFKTKSSHFLFSPYRNWFGSLNGNRWHQEVKS